MGPVMMEMGYSEVRIKYGRVCVDPRAALAVAKLATC